MKKPFVLIAAIVAVVGLGAAVAVAKETIWVGTSVTLKYNANDPSDPYRGGGSFSGKVKAKKGCEEGRKVFLRDTYRGKHGSDKSNDRGKYRILFQPGPSGRGRRFFRGRIFFHAYAKRKITKHNGDKIVCKEDRSDRFWIGRLG